MNVPSKYPEDVEAGRRVGRHVEAYMKRHHLGVNEMAQLLQVNHGTVSRMLSGECGVGLGLALRISRCLVISPHDLLLHEPRPE